MVKCADVLLIGGGLTSAFNVENLRKEGFKGSIIILAEEEFLPYYRPQLPKAYLMGKRSEDQMMIFHPSYYENNNIEVLLHTKALAVMPEKKIVKTDRAGDIRYKQLLIASGCGPIPVNIPGSHLAGIHYLRTILDAKPIVSEIAKATRAVIWGGSFIGIEVASLLIEKNIKVTIVTEEFSLFNVSPSADIATFIQEHGVDVVLGETIKKFIGKDCVRSVQTNTGKTIACDFVIIAQHFVPNTDFLKGSGIEVDDGVVVDQFLRTNKEGIYAAGDVAKFYDPIFKRLRRNGGTDNAMKQGKISAHNMLGMRRSYNSASYFYFQAFNNSIVIIGDTTGATLKIVRGSLKDRNIALLYLKDGYLQGAFFSGRPTEEIKAAESLIINRVSLKPYIKQLHKLHFSLENIAMQKILSLQGGGALGAFECGVVKAMEEYGIYPDIVSGISIGAFNAAIIAGNPGNASKVLEAFWNDLSINFIDPANEQMRRYFASLCAIAWGSPNFFFPRWFMPIDNAEQFPIHWTSFYDTSAIKALLRKYIDFDFLKDSPVRLLVMAVNVETSEFETFDNYTDNITPDHILASGSLPPGFPWTTIDNKHYWDGGIVTNTPIDATLDICGSTNKEIYIVELYSRNRALPKNMFEVLTRKDEILFSEKIRKDLHTRELIATYKKLIEGILSFCEPSLVEEVKQYPTYIQLMGDPGVLSTTRIVREIAKDEAYSWDSDFSRETIELHKKHGYQTAKKILKKEHPKR